jgi:Tol biopolymer transport system component
MGLDWTPGGRVLFDSDTNGSSHLWSIETDGTGIRQLTFGPANVGGGGLAVSPDGRVIAFVSGRSGQWEIWRTDSDGATQRQLTHGGPGVFSGDPRFTSDGAWIVYARAGGSDRASWKVPANGGEPVPLFPKAAQPRMTDDARRLRSFVVEAISPDGRWFAGTYLMGDATTDRLGTAIVSADGTKPSRELDVGEYSGSLVWTRDGGALAYARSDNGASNIWVQPLDGGPPRRLTSFVDQRIYGFAWSRDGRKLAISRGEFTSDVVMITDESKSLSREKP